MPHPSRVGSTRRWAIAWLDLLFEIAGFTCGVLVNRQRPPEDEIGIGIGIGMGMGMGMGIGLRWCAGSL